MCHKFRTCFNIVMPTNTITSMKTNNHSNYIHKTHFDLNIRILLRSLDVAPTKLIECDFLTHSYKKWHLGNPLHHLMGGRTLVKQEPKKKNKLNIMSIKIEHNIDPILQCGLVPNINYTKLLPTRLGIDINNSTSL